MARPDVCPTPGCDFEAPDPDGEGIEAAASSDGSPVCPEHGVWFFFVGPDGRAL